MTRSLIINSVISILVFVKDGKMIELLVALAVMTFLFGIGFHITGAFLSAAIWLFIQLPFAFILGCIGLVCCVTILLIPLGVKCFKFATSVIT